ncbi:cell division cycle- protein [Entomophthora muscae]|uniref:Cell division cycle- protein n=1 Tax=Entomophthora muscae TaxID=34485 RepID=A0ACC2SFI4_9FUNG|nr:cell division cycle- protein [Entomophthora muscae]
MNQQQPSMAETISARFGHESKTSSSLTIAVGHMDKSRSLMTQMRQSLFPRTTVCDRRLSGISLLGQGRPLLHSRSRFTPLDFTSSHIIELPAFRVDGPMEKELRRKLPAFLYLELGLCMGHPRLFPGDHTYAGTMPWPEYDPVACSEQHIEHTTHEAVTRAATLNGVLHRLACQGATDNELMEDFLRTYHYCTTGRDLLRMIFARYINCLFGAANDQWSSIIKLKLVNLLKKWVGGYCSVFRNCPALLEFAQAILRFMGDTEPNRRPFIHGILDELTSPMVDVLRRAPIYEPASALAGLSEVLDIEVLRPTSFAIRFIDIEPRALAQQLTLMEHSLFCAIQPEEFYHQAWNDKLHREYTSPNLWALIQMFNRIAHFITQQVLDQKETTSQAAVLSHAIRVARQCSKLSNYNSAFEILAGLNGALVTKLSRAWQQLPSRDKRDHSKLSQLLSTSENYKAYREAIRNNHSSALLPFVGVSLTDLVFAENGNPTYFKHGTKNIPPGYHFPSPSVPYINLPKLHLMSSIMTQLLSYQLVPYQLDTDAPIQSWILQHMLQAPPISPLPSPKYAPDSS